MTLTFAFVPLSGLSNLASGPFWFLIAQTVHIYKKIRFQNFFNLRQTYGLCTWIYIPISILQKNLFKILNVNLALDF